MNDFDPTKHTESARLRAGIVQAPSPILYRATHNYDLESPATKQEIIRDYKFLSALLDGTENGIAIAANQGGLNKSMFVHRLYDDYTAVINPLVWVPEGAVKQEVDQPEGCLSHPQDLFLKTGLMRYPVVYATFWEYPGFIKCIGRKMNGFEAQMFQHEIDHLCGYTIVERVKESS